MKTPLLALFVVITTFAGAQGFTLYGLTQYGGLFNQGTIFSYNPGTHAYKVVYNFGSVGGDGSLPQCALMQASNGLLYGVTQAGGANQAGTIFSYNISTGNCTKLYDFGTNDDCINPSAALYEGSPGVLFGSTLSGGTFGLGAIFSYDIATGGFTDVHDFFVLPDGYSPNSAFVSVGDSMLYATTVTCQTYNTGTIFSYNLLSQAETVLLNFDSVAPQGQPSMPALIVVNDSLLYGIADETAGGAIFSYNIFTGVYTNVYQIVYPLYGAYSFGSFILGYNGLFYGTADEGGAFYDTTPGQSGVLYYYDPVNSVQTVLHNFGHPGDGFTPGNSLMQASDGLLYGTTVYGGAAGNGLLYSYNIFNNEYVALHHFTGDIDGASPRSSLLQVSFPTSIAKITPAMQLQISPNPSTGQFTIQLPGTQDNYPVQIYNPLGQKIQQLTLTQTPNTLNLSNQPPGIYFVNVQTDLGNVAAKVVVLGK